jgi:hypothetical protein
MIAHKNDLGSIKVMVPLKYENTYLWHYSTIKGGRNRIPRYIPQHMSQSEQLRCHLGVFS